MESRPVRLLFVCSGNLCRSPMAEYLAREGSSAAGVEVEARSAGTLGLVDRAPPPNALAVMREKGISMDAHRSQPLSTDLVEWADHILVMTLEHAEWVHQRFPEAGNKVKLLGPYGAHSQEIDDPMGWWRPTFRKVRDQIAQSVGGFLSRIEA
jgi:protein-tyrosine phosphatase